MPIDPSTGAVSVAPSTAVATTRKADMVLSPDGLTLYASGSDGNVRVHNAETGELISTIAVGKQLGAIDVSPDGGFLMAVETKIISTTGNFWGGKTKVTVYKVDLASGEVTSFPFIARDYDTTFSDVTVLADGKVLLTQNFAGSGWVDLKLLDPATGLYESRESITQTSILSRTTDGSLVLVGESNISDAPMNLYRSGFGIFARHNTYQDDVMGFNNGMQAISGNGALVAQYVYGAIHIYDGALDHKLDLISARPNSAPISVGGLAFDPEGKFLFILDCEADVIVQFATSNWNVVRKIPVGFDAIEGYSSYGNSLLVGPDLRFFTIWTDTGIQRVDNPAVADALAGTEAADTITGTEAAETVLGFGGDDRLDGGLGVDVMAGGKGDDIYIAAQGADAIVEKAGEGSDTVFASVSYKLADHVEQLVLTGTSGIDGRGNDAANFLIGNGAANRLNGGAGADTMNGGLGGDTYVVDNRGDRIVETAAGGTDSVEASVSYTLGADVENLALALGAVAGTGNDLANRIVGNNGDNVLDGRGGADVMTGGKGNDTYFVNSSGDVVEEEAAEGTDTVKSSFGYVLGEHLENLMLTGAAAIDGTGNEAANILFGNGAANELRGLDGADMLDGKGGADTMKGGSGDDLYIIDNSADAIVEAAAGGMDSVSSTVTFVLAAGVENLTLVGSAAIDGTGNGAANRLDGNEVANRLDGAGGNDTILGNAGSDELAGGAGSDTLDGGGGADRIFGGVGNDVFAGGRGADGFYFDTSLNRSSNVDKILDFAPAADTIFLSAGIFSALPEGQLAESAFAEGTTAQDDDDRIVYNPVSGKIFYDADGAGGMAAILFAQVGAGTPLGADDFVIYG